LLLAPWFGAGAAEPGKIESRTTYSQAYGKTKNPVTVDPAKDLPRVPAVEPGDATGTWRVKPGFRLELAAHEPEVRDPVALCFDERGRMFVCEMIDYSERRDENPHLGRVSVLEDRDGDGRYETSRVFVDDLPWPTGLIWAAGGLYVAATPDIWRCEDRDGDGRAEVREKAFTGFGTGLKILNVQGLLNSFQWGQDNRVHVLAGGGNRGVVTSPKRPDLPGVELAGRDFWFDPRTHAFGLEPGGAQYGMSFDDFGRKFGCSNSDHLQHWVHDLETAAPGSGLPRARQSIAVDGGAAEVFRISPDEPWRIVRTRWRVAGTVPGAVEGGGRVSGYFTGATGTTIYRGDAYGAAFANNSFTGDAGGQLAHRKVIRPGADGVNLEGERPPDERDREFAASTDPWVRVVNFANAPDGCLHLCDMYREVIEHPWSIPDEIKRHLDLNQGNDRGRIYRLVPEGWTRPADPERRGDLSGADTARLVALLRHPNGWHRDTAQRLLFEQGDPAAGPLLEALLRDPSGPATAKLHALGLLASSGRFRGESVEVALRDAAAPVRERALRLLRHGDGVTGPLPEPAIAALSADADPRVRFELALGLGVWLAREPGPVLREALVTLARRDHGHPWIGPAVLAGAPGVVGEVLFPALAADEGFVAAAGDGEFLPRLVSVRAATVPPEGHPELVGFVVRHGVRPAWLQALGDGLRQAGHGLEAADRDGKLAEALAGAARRAADPSLGAAERVAALQGLRFASPDVARPAWEACLASGETEAVQTAAVRIWLGAGGTDAAAEALGHWPALGAGARKVLVEEMMRRPERMTILLDAVGSGAVPGEALDAAQVQALAGHGDGKIAALARRVLGDRIPPSREEVMARYGEAAALAGDATRGRIHYLGRCAACHRAEGQGMVVGPDLVTVKARGRDALLASILDPNREVAAQYIVHTVTTKDGEQVSGFIAEDTAAAVTLTQPGGLSRTVPRGEIRGSSSAGQSLMPEGLEAGMTSQDLADLLTFIETLP
jgi:putative membrane-bound dehydrogenase-like protein